MKGRYLEVTYRKGSPLAAYLYLPREPDDHVFASEPVDGDMVIDRAADGRVIGVEILSPATLTATALNDVLERCGLLPVSEADLRPLPTAA